MWRRALIPLGLGISVSLWACSSEEEEEPPAKVVASQDFVQDLWVYERIRSVNSQGQLIELNQPILAAFDRKAERVVKLGEGVSFSLYDGLEAKMIGWDGKVREDVHVVAGIIEAENGKALSVLATPLAGSERAIGPADSVDLDFSFLGDILGAGDPLFLDYTFLQAIPFLAEPKPGTVGSLELLGARLRAGSIQYLGSEEDVEEQGAGHQTLQFWKKKAVDFAKDQAASTVEDRVADDLHNKAVRGRLPAKSNDMTRGMVDGVQQCGWLMAPSIKCVGEFFKSFGEGAHSSFNTALCNGNMGNCNPGPEGPERRPPRENPWDPPRDPRSEPWRNPPPRPNCVSGCGRSVGDPHLATFDGHYYDLQAVGEFIAARSNELELQIRTSPLEGSQTISLTTGLALGVGGHRLTAEVSERGSGLVLRTDGEEVVNEGWGLGYDVMPFAGGQLIYNRYAFHFESEDGHVVAAFLTGEMLDLYVDPADRELSWEGLFGDRDGDRQNDLKLRDGEVLSWPLGFEDLYDRFAMEWRVSDEESLFDYPEGKGTADYSDLNFPERPAQLSDFPEAEQRRARTICQEAGVKEQPMLDDCMLDWMVTGNIDMLRSAQETTSVVHGRGPSDGGGGGLPDDEFDYDEFLVRASWLDGLSESRRGEAGQTYTFDCKPGGNVVKLCPGKPLHLSSCNQEEGGFPLRLAGTDIYADDSSVCAAAVHAGKIEVATGGEVTIETRPGENKYEGSERNGVTSQDRGRTRGSFIFP